MTDEMQRTPDPQTMADRYATLWNDPDPEARARTVRSLWAVNGEHVLDPPQEMVDRARSLGFDRPSLAVRGHEAIEARVAHAFEEFVAPGRYVFRASRNAVRLRDVVTFGWEMISTATGEVKGGGREVLLLDKHDCIVVDCQFPGA